MYYSKPLIIVRDEKGPNAEYLVQLISQPITEDAINTDFCVEATIYTTKQYKDNSAQISSDQRILFVGPSEAADQQRATIPDKYNELGMHYGWLGKRAVLYVDDSANDWLKNKDERIHYAEFRQISKGCGLAHPDVLAEYNKKPGEKFVDKVAGAVKTVADTPKMQLEHGRLVKDIKAQQYQTLEMIFYRYGLKFFMEG